MRTRGIKKFIDQNLEIWEEDENGQRMHQYYFCK